MKISVIIVSYNIRKLLIGCLTSVRKFLPSDTEIIVVENASHDGSAEVVEEQFQEITLIKNSQNLGFAKACNQGIEVARGEAVMLVNSDIEFRDDSYKLAVEYLEKADAVGIIGPRLLNSDGTLQPSAFHSFPSLLSAPWENALASRIVNKLFPKISFPGKYLCSTLEHESLLCPAHVMGAVLLLRKETWKEAGGFDERFFMFREETDLCRRARDLGWKVLYVPGFSVFHHQGESTCIRGLDKKLELYFRSTYLYHEKHFGWASSIVLYAFNLFRCSFNCIVYSLIVAAGKAMRIESISHKLGWYLTYNCLSRKIHLAPHSLLGRSKQCKDCSSPP